MTANYIYAYTHQAQRKKWSRSSGQAGEFWIKVGQTNKAGIGRVRQQLITSFPGLDGVQVFFHSEPATLPSGKTFSDHDLHRLLISQGIENPAGEWFQASPEEVKAAIVSLRNGTNFSPNRVLDFRMRPEQERAVEITAEYFKQNSDAPMNKFLWNAKMRFGKTFTTFQLAKRMGWKRTLILTYKPAVRSAWRDDLLGHTDFDGWRYVDRETPEQVANSNFKSEHPLVCFASFQDVTGRDSRGNPKPRNERLARIRWDCIVVDEFHFGASTDSAREVYDPQDKDEVAMAKMLNRALDEGSTSDADVLEAPDHSLKTRYHLHLSGTPFKAITRGQYSEDQIFNWTYIDEQREKKSWSGPEALNPYADLPQMKMYTYQIGGMASEIASEGEFDGFNLNTFFRAKKSDEEYVFERPDGVRSFLDLIKGKKSLSYTLNAGKEVASFPYQAAQFAEAVRNSIWYMYDVAACEAMAQLLREDPFFGDFEIYVAAGTKAKTGAAALPPLKRAIEKSSEDSKSGSITLTCGKLMTGVTVPEWCSIFMLRSLKAPESYFQAAFRVQSPWRVDGEIKKETAYVFEFDPNRALNLVALYGTELGSNQSLTQREVLGELVNYLPIFSVDGGFMEELDVQAILDWAHAGISANSLARRWDSYDLYNLNEITMSKLLSDEDLLAELEQIEDFRRVRRQAETIVSNSNKLKKLKSLDAPASSHKPARKAIAKQRKDMREKLKKVSAKVLMFMYLTDFREESLRHVIETLDTELFLRSTGLSLSSYQKLVDIGVIVESTMTDAIQKFRYYEKKSISAMLEVGLA